MLANTGAGTYSIPIEVPTGRGGIAPNLSLIYNSEQGNGWVGVGWMLDMGAIQRSTNTPGGINYSSTSTQFVAVANGSVSNLVQNSGWGSDNYENEIDGSFLNYYYNASSDSWQVKDKSGTTYYYGSAGSSKIANSNGTFKWLLDKVQDVNGNYMTVSYTQDQGQAYLSEIDYTGNASGSGMFEEHVAAIQSFRQKVRDQKRVATCVGFGPRFLHSTGQDYKGGPNYGVFLQITADHADDMDIPGQKYSFGVVIDAQAAGDLAVLESRGRRALRVHLGADVAAGLKALALAELVFFGSFE